MRDRRAVAKNHVDPVASSTRSLRTYDEDLNIIARKPTTTKDIYTKKLITRSVFPKPRQNTKQQPSPKKKNEYWHVEDSGSTTHTDQLGSHQKAWCGHVCLFAKRIQEFSHRKLTLHNTLLWNTLIQTAPKKSHQKIHRRKAFVFDID